MNEMKPILSRWLLYNYTTVKTSTFWKLCLKPYNLGFPFIKGLSSNEWNENHTSTKISVKLYYFENFLFLKSKFETILL